MADAHPNAQLFRTAYEALSDGDASALREVLADDVVWHMVGDEEPIRGADAVADAITADLGDVEFDGEIHDVLANDEHIVALVDATLRRGDEETSYRATEIAHVEDGHITERWSMVDDFEAMASFWE